MILVNHKYYINFQENKKDNLIYFWSIALFILIKLIFILIILYIYYFYIIIIIIFDYYI